MPKQIKKEQIKKSELIYRNLSPVTSTDIGVLRVLPSLSTSAFILNDGTEESRSSKLSSAERLSLLPLQYRVFSVVIL